MKTVCHVAAVFVTLCLCMGLLAGCAAGDNKATTAKDTKKLSVVCTTFPSYDWAREVIGSNSDSVNLTFLLGNGTDLHSYQPTVQDMGLIGDCDLFVYVGGESESWVADALTNAANKNMRTVNLMDELGSSVRAEELVEGMQPEEEGHTSESGEAEYDEHVWLSLRNAQVATERIAAQLGEIDADHADDYQRNAQDYIAKLKELDDLYQTNISSAARKTVLFGDRFPFRYLLDDYGISYYAAFAGCSAETEASFETVTFLSKKMDELKLPAVLVTESSDQKVAETIIKSTKRKKQQILAMDSMQSTTSDDALSGTTYMRVMKRNLKVLVKALS